MKQKRCLWVGFVVVLFTSLTMSNGNSFGNTMSDLDKKKKIMSLIGSFEKKFRTPQISVEELAASINNKESIVLVDVRESHEQKVSMLPGAISKEEFLKTKNKYKGKKIVTYCTIGYRSSELSEELKEDGFDAFNLRGSILLWAHSGGRVVNKNGDTKEVHVYGKSWDLLPTGYKGITGK